MRRGVGVLGAALYLAAGTARAAEPAPPSPDDARDVAPDFAPGIDEPRSPDMPRLTGSRTPEISTEYFVETHDGFTVAYHPAARERVREVVPKLAQMRDELARALGVPVLAEVELRIAALPIEVDRLAPAHEPTVSAHGGFAFPERALVIVSLGGAEAAGEDLEAALRHHLAHVALVQATNGARVPSWFQEGFAVHFAKARSWGRLAELEMATFAGDPPSLEELAAHPAATAAGGRAEALAADFVRFASSGNAFAQLFDGLRRGLAFDQALAEAFGTDASGVDRAWRKDTQRRYGIVPIAVLALVVVCLAILVRVLRRRAKLKKASPPRHVLRPRPRFWARRRESKIRVPIHVADQEVPRVEHDGRWHTLH